MKKYKLLYFVSEDHYFLTHKLPHALLALKNNFDVLVVCNTSKYKKKILSYGFNIKHINLDRKSINPFQELKTLTQLITIISDFKPDIIQSVALKPIIYCSFCKIFFSKIIKLNVYSIVGLGYLFINRGLFNYFLKRIVEVYLKLFLGKKKSIIIFQNKEDLSYFIKKKIITQKQSTIISGSGVNIDHFKPTKKIKKKYDLLMHSRMLIDKGIYDLINAIYILRKKNISLKVLLLGDPDLKNRASIKKEYLEELVRKKIIDWVPSKPDVLPYIQRSRIGILPSYREGFPKSLLEAASCGLPLISTNVAGCKEICINGYNGFLAQVKDPQDLAKKIEKLLFNKKSQFLMGKKSRKICVEKFSDGTISKEFLKIYNSIKN
ncbi:glycosyltransferase family 4 protein [Rickettsiales bacterium]|nr:glycosyltransferase family 4 protein [Rickettsiales bacterium]